MREVVVADRVLCAARIVAARMQRLTRAAQLGDLADEVMR
jgi:hypothetical protein